VTACWSPSGVRVTTALWADKHAAVPHGDTVVGTNCIQHPSTRLAGVEDRALVYQSEGRDTSLLDAIRNLLLRPVDGETKARSVPHGAFAVPLAWLCARA
jgi:hypothetical protein